MSPRHLVIVESPAKARTIGKYLGRDYDVAASVGHVRDLPPKELGVDVEHGFEPKYVTIRGKGKVISELKAKAARADMVILATDPDREGEAIAYHVAEQLGYEKDKTRFQRVTFREITKSAVEKALASPGPLDMGKIEAQQARRILDRLVGYQVSPLLWKPIRPGLSAGRVQTVALRLICEREDEIRAFVQQEYWSIIAHLERAEQLFDAKLHKIDGKAFTLENEASARAVVDDLVGRAFAVTDIKRRERRKNPFPPFTTSTLQQEAAKRLGFSARRTMSSAQRLYEGQALGDRGEVGLITYMRTDSTRVSPEAVNQARDWIRNEFGGDYVPSAPQLYGGQQQRAAQDAHEAIRPTDVTIHPNEAVRYLEPDQARLYEMIWLRFVASQMTPAVYDTTTVDFDLSGSSRRRYVFRATGSIVKFPGFTRLYIEATEAGDYKRLDDLEPLPDLAPGDSAALRSLEPKQHFTQPPPRFSEASLVKELEEKGIGRPSTYAQIISVIVDRGYVDLDQRRFKPTDLGEVVSKLLVRLFPDIFDVNYTSKMETDLDRVEEGEIQWQTLLADFYPPFLVRLEAGEASSDHIIREILAAEGETCDKCGRPMIVRWNRFGRFLGCSGYPECKSTRSLDGVDPEGKELGVQPETGLKVKLKVGPYGPYIELEAAPGVEKPKRVSVPKDRKPEDIDLPSSLKLLELPRTVGIDPSGEEIVAAIGRFGPFVRRAKTFASLKGTEALWTVTLEEATALLDAKASGKRAPLRELGKHPKSGADIVIFSGRYGPYVTDGEVNATLPKDVEPEGIDLDAALDLLAKKAGRGGKARGRKSPKGSPKGSPKARKKK